jgi:cell division protein FtsX
VNNTAARALWPGTSAIGKQICVDCTPEHPSNWKRVIGVVSTVRHADLDARPGWNVYLSAGALSNVDFLVVRTNRPMGEMEKAVRRAIFSIDPDQPVLLSASMQSLISDTGAERRFVMSLLAATACLALLMSIAGIYGVVSYTTSRRTQEIGIRMALGATRSSVHALVFRQGFFAVVIGLAVGVGLTAVLLHVLRGVIAGVGAGLAANFWITACLVAITAAMACWIPARHATKIDPMRALREE